MTGSKRAENGSNDRGRIACRFHQWNLKRNGRVFTGRDIGPSYDGVVEQTIDATDRLIIPGFINSHLHLTDTPFTKGHQEDAGSGGQSYTALYKMLPGVRKASDPDAQYAAARCAVAELALSGSTTIVELGYDFEIGGGGNIELIEKIATIVGESGLRCYSGPRYRTRFYGADSKGGVFYQDYPNGARERFEACIEFCRQWDGKFDGRLRTMLAPGQIDTCDPQLLKDTRRYADELGIPIQIHAGQSSNEFARVSDHEGRTTVEYMMDTGLLGSNFIIGHGQFLSADGDISSMGAHEIAAIRDSGTTISHLPWVKARRGGVINSIQKYMDLGIKQSLGTDNYPLDMFHEMQVAAILCKVVEHSPTAARSEDVFHMATVGGADALGRSDLGRLAAGCKADIVLVRTDTPKAAPVFDPFKFMVQAASGDDVDTVIVDGHIVVAGGKMLTMDVADAVKEVNHASKRVWDRLDF